MGEVSKHTPESASTERKAAHIAIGYLSETIVEQDQIIQAQSALIAELVEALKIADGAVDQLCQGQDSANECWTTLETIRKAIAEGGAS